MNKIYTGIMYVGLTILMVFAPLARGATTTRLWAVTIVMVVMYAVVFAGVGRRVNRAASPQNYKGLRFFAPSVLRMTKGQLAISIGAFVFVALVSFVFSIYKHDSFYALLRLLGYAGIFYCLLYTSPSPRDRTRSRMPSSA